MKKASDLSTKFSVQRSWSSNTKFYRDIIVGAWLEEFGRTCQSCGSKMSRNKRDRGKAHYATIDHVEARGLDGGDNLDNIQVICLKCNNEKGLNENLIIGVML